MSRFISVYVEPIPQSIPHMYKVHLEQTQSPKCRSGRKHLCGMVVNFIEGKKKTFTSKTAAIAFGKAICKKIERRHPYTPNGEWKASLFVEGLGKEYNGSFLCINQRFVEYRKVR